MGEILIGGMASLLICIFLGPKFIEELREREFGQHIREEGPEGHHEKAGTPTMGGIVLFLAVTVPFLILSDYRAVSLVVLATALATALVGFADDWTKISKRRSLGLSGRNKLVVLALISVALWLAATEYVGLNDTLRLRVIDASVDLGYFYPVLILLVLLGRHERGEPHRRPRRAGRGLLRDRAAGLHRHDVHHHRPRPDGPRAAVRVPGRRVRWLPLVQLVPRRDLHGRHGIARIRGRHRGDRRDDEDRGAAAHHRRASS